MPSTYSNLKIQLMAAGENNTTWGNVTNVNIGTALGAAIAGSKDIVFADANRTLTWTDDNGPQDARNLRLNLTGTATAGYNLIVPSVTGGKPYIVNNGTDGTITVKNATGTGIAVPAGKTMWLYNDGTNVVDAVTHISSLTLATPLPISSGGTGSATSLTQGSVVFAGAAGVYSQDNTNFFWDDTNNRLGIGTATPSYKFEARTDAASGFNWIGSNNNTATGSFGAGFLATTGAGASYFYMRGDGVAYVENSSNNPLAFATNALERVRITNGGDLLVGTITAQGKLTVASATGNVGLNTGTSASPERGNLWYDTDGSGWNLNIGKRQGGAFTAQMTFQDNGSIGIGTTAPQSRLHVSGGYITAGNVSSTAGSRIIGGDYSGAEHITTFGSEFSSGGPVIGYGVWPSTVSALAFVSSAAPALQRAAYTQTGNSHVWLTGASQTVAVGSAVTMNERMRLDGSGNLGLGTAPSGARLDVNGNIRSTLGSGGTLSLFETDATRANQLFCGADASGSFINATFSTGGTATLRLQTANNEHMRINGAGDVGIGTINPASRFNVAGTAAINWVAGGTSSGLVTLGTQGTSGGSLFVNTPSVGSTFASGLGVDGSYTNPGGVGTSLVNIKAYGVNSGGGYDSALVFHTSLGTSLTEKFRITSTGAITSSNLADAVGYKGIPQNSQTASYTLALSDMGKHISITTGGVVIPANGSVAFPIGSAVTIFNNSGSNQTISITTDTLRQAGTANTGSRTLAQYGIATVLKVTSTVWVISGAGVS